MRKRELRELLRQERDRVEYLEQRVRDLLKEVARLKVTRFENNARRLNNKPHLKDVSCTPCEVDGSDHCDDCA